MEKQTIFRKVAVKDRLPKEEGVYLVTNNQGWFEAIFDHNFSFHGEFTDCSGVEYWLEEIELPSEEEISKSASLLTNFSKNDEWVETFKLGFQNGANYILNLLK